MFFGQNPRHVLVGIAGMDDERQAGLARCLDMQAQAFLLNIGRLAGVVVIQPGFADADQARAALQTHPQLAERYEVFFEDNYTRRNTRILADIEGTARAVGIIALIAVILGSYNATGLSLVERQRQIGILRVVGFRPGSVRQLLLFQALAQGLAGFGLGLLVALAFVAYQQSTSQLYAYGWPLSFSLTLEIVALGLFLVIGLAGVGALLATRTMLAATPAEAMGA